MLGEGESYFLGTHSTFFISLVAKSKLEKYIRKEVRQFLIGTSMRNVLMFFNFLCPYYEINIITGTLYRYVNPTRMDIILKWRFPKRSLGFTLAG